MNSIWITMDDRCEGTVRCWAGPKPPVMASNGCFSSAADAIGSTRYTNSWALDCWYNKDGSEAKELGISRGQCVEFRRVGNSRLVPLSRVLEIVQKEIDDIDDSTYGIIECASKAEAEQILRLLREEFE